MTIWAANHEKKGKQHGALEGKLAETIVLKNRLNERLRGKIVNKHAVIIKILVVKIVKIEEKIVERIVLQGKKNAGIIKIHAVKKEGSVEKNAVKTGRTELTVFSERAIEETREEQTVINVVKIDIKDRMIAGITVEIAKTTEERIVRNAEKIANTSVTSDLLTDEHVRMLAGSDVKTAEKLEGLGM